jgi:phage shock protein A
MDDEAMREVFQRVTALEVLAAERQKQNEALQAAVKELATNVAALNNIITEAKGGKRVIVILLSLAASMGGLASWVLSHVKWSL